MSKTFQVRYYHGHFENNITSMSFKAETDHILTSDFSFVFYYQIHSDWKQTIF